MCVYIGIIEMYGVLPPMYFHIEVSTSCEELTTALPV